MWDIQDLILNFTSYLDKDDPCTSCLLLVDAGALGIW